MEQSLLLCRCETIDIMDMEDGWWKAHPVSYKSAHHTTNTHRASSTSSISGISRTHNSSTSHHSGKSNSKLHTQNTIFCQEPTPDIPINMSAIHSNPLFRGLDNHSAHIEHYLSSYTYPHLQQILAASLPAHTGVQCSHCSAVCSTNSLMSGGRRGGLVRPSVIRVLLEDTLHKSSTPTLTSPLYISGSPKFTVSNWQCPTVVC